MNAGGSRIAVGTIAPPGDPNVFLLDAEGKVISQQAVGQRWIDQIAVGAEGNRIHLRLRDAAGTSGDGPEVYTLSADKQTLEPPSGFDGQSPLWYYHYGEHSNHLARLLRRDGRTVAIVTCENVAWLGGSDSQRQDVRLPHVPREGVITSLAAGEGGYALMGVATGGQTHDRPDLVLLRRRQGPRLSAVPVWRRAATMRVAPPSTPEPGLYGVPRPDGEPGVPTGPGAGTPLAQRDEPVSAPLSAAIYVPPGDSGDDNHRRLRIAVADHAGWQRWVRSNATGMEESRCIRFVPAGRQ